MSGEIKYRRKTIADCIEMYANGHSIRSIADEKLIDQARIRDWINKYYNFDKFGFIEKRYSKV